MGCYWLSSHRSAQCLSLAVVSATLLGSATGCQVLLGLEVPPAASDANPAGSDGGQPNPDAVAVPPELCDWQYVRTIEIDNALVGTDTLNDVPVLVVLNDARIDYSAAGAAGESLRFGTPAGQRLPHEIELWNPNGDSYVWVQLRRIRGESNTNVVLMFYGNPGAPDDQQPAMVWNDTYAGVWHLSEDARDSTQHGNDGDLRGGPNFQPGGRIGNGLLFNGANDYIEIPASESLNDLTQFTYSAWINATVYNEREIFSKRESYRELRLLDAGDGVRLRGCVVMDSDDSCSNSEPDAVELNRWQHVAMTLDTSDDQLVHLYINGVEVVRDFMEEGAGLPAPDANSALNIGRRTNDQRYFGGLIDEARVANVAHSPAWIAVQFASATDALLTFQGQTKPAGCQ